MFVQKIKFIVMNMHKNVATRAAPFGSDICTKSFVGSGFAPDPLGQLTSLDAPPHPLAGLGVGPTGNGKAGGEGKGGYGVPECPNPELASLLLVRNAFTFSVN